MNLKMAEQKGLEPSASGVTGRRYNRLNYCSAVWWAVQILALRPPPCEGPSTILIPCYRWDYFLATWFLGRMFILFRMPKSYAQCKN